MDSWVDLILSVSSILNKNFPYVFFANNQLNKAVLALPIWRFPVGEGANLVTIFIPRFFLRNHIYT